MSTALYLLVTAAVVTAVPASVLGQSGGEWKTDFSKHTVPLDEIVSGGPPKDGIPAIDHPMFVAVPEADRWLDGREPVVVVSIAGETKAYPLQILIWHEIVNDVVGSIPVAVTYCPLCNTALAFDRRLDGRVLDFGTTGRLRYSDLVMYDRQTETWWQQATGEGIVGVHAGRELTFIPAPLVSWETFTETYPDGRVLSRETGYERAYGRNPYIGYDDRDGSPWKRLFRSSTDGRLRAMERVVSVTLAGRDVAYAFSALERERVVNDAIAGRSIVVFWIPGTASAVDAARIAEGRDVGSTAVFSREVGARTLTFEPAGDDRFRDRDTGSLWSLFGRAVEGPQAGTVLEAVPHGNHFWFAWGVFKPGTRVWK